MKAMGWAAMMEKGFRFANDDVLIQECRLKNGKHRHRRVRHHKRIYNKIARARTRAKIKKALRVI